MKVPAFLPPLLLLALAGWAASFSGCQTHQPRAAFTPEIPKTWDDAAIASLELPLANPAASPKYIDTAYYYRQPVRPIYRSYPIYHPNKEPPGYLDRLKQQKPEAVWDETRGIRPPLKTKADWVRAGEIVFDAAITYSGPGSFFQLEGVRDPAWYSRVGVFTAKDGSMPFARYVIRTNGVVEVSDRSCAMCHTRVMPDGSAIKGAQGNFPADHAIAELIRDGAASLGASQTLAIQRSVYRLLFDTPWIHPDPLAGLRQMSYAETVATYEAIPPGVNARHGTSPLQPVQVPDLIGVQGRRYLDRSGLVRHRDIGDVMRYAAFNQGADLLNRYGDFIPAGEDYHALPPAETQSRYSDEQLYVLALYVYSLKPPPNPNKFDALAKRGKEIFHEEGCAKCHDPKQGYTNNKLIRAPGFEVPANHPERDNIMRQRVNTDPGLTMTTRRGTGFYKVPSLLGVWSRGPFEHNGSCATLEDWFNPARTNDTYVPTGWKGPPGTKTRAVNGHEFGLDLADEDRKALITFLRTL